MCRSIPISVTPVGCFASSRLLSLFYRDALDQAVKYKDNPTDLEDQILEELDNFDFKKEEDGEEKKDEGDSD